MAKKPSGVRTGTHSAGGRKRYTDVKRRTTRTPSKRNLWLEKHASEGSIPTRHLTHPNRSFADQIRAEGRADRKAAAKANKRKSTTSGRFHSGSAIKNAADVSMNNPPGW